MRAGVALLALLMATACRYRPEPIPIQGARDDIARLAGTWVGEYSGTTSGRNGSITFMLKAGTDSAFGDVLMVPRGAMNELSPADNPVEHQRHAGSAQVLRISFVSISAHRVTGTLEPYIAPDCDCTVRTAFTGTIGVDAVEGTFVSRAPGGYEQIGRWRVVRR